MTVFPRCSFCDRHTGTIATTNGHDARNLCNDCWRSVWRYKASSTSGSLWQRRWAARKLRAEVTARTRSGRDF